MIDDSTGNGVGMPASIAALSALGFNDSVSHPWFAPAGFNRAALSNVTNVDTRLNSADRDDLYDQLKYIQKSLGAVPSPCDCWLVIMAVKTLHLSMH